MSGFNARGAGAGGKLAMVRGNLPRRALKMSPCLSDFNFMTRNISGIVWVGGGNHALFQGQPCFRSLISPSHPHPPSAQAPCNTWAVYGQDNSNLTASCPVSPTHQKPAQKQVRFICSNYHDGLNAHFYRAAAWSEEKQMLAKTHFEVLIRI